MVHGVLTLLGLLWLFSFVAVLALVAVAPYREFDTFDRAADEAVHLANDEGGQ